MKIFVCEYVTGGGLAGQPLPGTLTHEADRMVRALLADLAVIPGIELLTSRDPRLPPIEGFTVLEPRIGESLAELYSRGLAQVDAAWPTAPESGGALLQLATLTRDSGRQLLGSAPDAVALATSKMATARLLQSAGIPVVDTYVAPRALPELPGAWVIKPDDGAGCEETTVVEGWAVAAAALAARPAGSFIAQPWLAGASLSLSLLCCAGEARLLSVNRQQMMRRAGQLHLAGLEVNALADDAGGFERLGDQVAAVLPSLWGYVGVDFIATPSGPVVLEINPRLTTSYCGLRQALGLNLPQLVLGLLDTGLPPRTTVRPGGRPVALSLEVPRER
jgi:predicted ATP-grasp superfamily ATP-dependent carboligase